jgi:hypothetical protein
MKRWEAIGKNGGEITEEDINWDLVKNKVIKLSLNNNGQIITLPHHMEYVQGKTASAFLNSDKIKIESRYIGITLGNNIVKVRVNEETNDISIEVESCENNSNSKPIR